MVIRYSPAELNAIGEMVILRECISRMQSDSSSPTSEDNQAHLVPDNHHLVAAENSQNVAELCQRVTEFINFNNNNNYSNNYNQTNHHAANYNQDFIQLQAQIQQLGHQMPFGRSEPAVSIGALAGVPIGIGAHRPVGATADLATGGQASLTPSVAEFFRKAQQNFYLQPNIEPTHVRRLSEVEAELIGNRRDSC